jgi:hypothetical protein
MHPYTAQAISTQRIADMESEAASERLARQARARRSAASPEAGSYCPDSVGGHKRPLQRLLGRWVSGRVLSA